MFKLEINIIFTVWLFTVMQWRNHKGTEHLRCHTFFSVIVPRYAQFSLRLGVCLCIQRICYLWGVRAKIGTMFKTKNKGVEEEKPIALKNYYTGEIHYDTLHTSVDRVWLMKLVLYCHRVRAIRQCYQIWISRLEYMQSGLKAT